MEIAKIFTLKTGNVLIVYKNQGRIITKQQISNLGFLMNDNKNQNEIGGDKMTNERKLELFENLIGWLSEAINEKDAFYTLDNIGFTEDEIKFIFDMED